MYDEQEARLIRQQMPVSIVNTLGKVRAKHWGKLPKTRDEFDIQAAIDKVQSFAGGDVIV